MIKKIIPLALTTVIFSSCQSNVEPTTKLTITSEAFLEGESIPSEYTCDRDNLSPQLSISDLPENTQSLSIIVDDPDAREDPWVHWIIFNTPTGQSINKGISKEITLPDGTGQGINDFDQIGYDGPCPPNGETHTYEFKIYALSEKLDLTGEITKEDLLEAIEGKILAEGKLTGEYSRKL